MIRPSIRYFTCRDAGNRDARFRYILYHDRICSYDNIIGNANGTNNLGSGRHKHTITQLRRTRNIITPLSADCHIAQQLAMRSEFGARTYNDFPM